MPIRVLVVEDSLTVRKRLCDALSADPNIEVIAEAADGKAAIEICQTLRPDVITMDMMLPVMSGLAATEFIMAYCPTPILIVSASTNRGELFKTYEALSAGALDVLEKYSENMPAEEWEKKLLSTVKLLARVKVITHPRARLQGHIRERPDRELLGSARTEIKFPRSDYSLIAIGASTGGPSAIADVLRGLPADLKVPVLFVLHISEPFGKGFAEWLDGQTGRTVRYGREGESVDNAAGQIIMAPPEFHMELQNRRLKFHQGPARHSCRPSVDVLFESVARELGPRGIGCLLTGMGKDGAAGLLQLKTAGGFTIAQDEATSIVYGMPREAMLLGAAELVLPLSEIGPALGKLAASGRVANRE